MGNKTDASRLRIDVDKLYLAFQRVTDNKLLLDLVRRGQIKQIYDAVADGILVEFRSALVSMDKGRIVVDQHVYETWFDHFKASCIPKWMLKLVGAVIHETHINIDEQRIIVCPHLEPTKDKCGEFIYREHLKVQEAQCSTPS